MNDDQAYQVATAALRLADDYPAAPWARYALELVYNWFALDAAGRREHWALIVDEMTPDELSALAELMLRYWPLGPQLYPQTN